MTSPITAARNVWSYLRRHPIAGRHPLASLARVAAWQVRSRTARGPIRHRWVNGTTLTVRRGMMGATGNVYLGLLEFTDMAFVLHFLRRGDLFFDVGANVGTYTVLAAGVREAQTWAFEPDPATVRDLTANIAANGLDERVRVVRAAVGDRSGEIGFTIGLDAVNRVASADEPQQMVPVERLDTLAGGAAPVLMKVDVEGFEDAVVAGAAAVLADPRLIALEIETVPAAAAATLATLGFRRCEYDAFSRTLTEVSADRPPSGNNSLYVRDIAAARERLRTAPTVTLHGVTF